MRPVLKLLALLLITNVTSNGYKILNFKKRGISDSDFKISEFPSFSSNSDIKSSINQDYSFGSNSGIKLGGEFGSDIDFGSFSKSALFFGKLGNTGFGVSQGFGQGFAKNGFGLENNNFGSNYNFGGTSPNVPQVNTNDLKNMLHQQLNSGTENQQNQAQNNNENNKNVDNQNTNNIPQATQSYSVPTNLPATGSVQQHELFKNPAPISVSQQYSNTPINQFPANINSFPSSLPYPVPQPILPHQQQAYLVQVPQQAQQQNIFSKSQESLQNQINPADKINVPAPETNSPSQYGSAPSYNQFGLPANLFQNSNGHSATPADTFRLPQGLVPVFLSGGQGQVHPSAIQQRVNNYPGQIYPGQVQQTLYNQNPGSYQTNVQQNTAKQ